MHMDWQAEVENYAAKSERHAARVVAAKVHTHLESDHPNYWEAIYTLVRQREQMEGARD